MVDASEMIAYNTRIIPAVLGNEILQPQSPLGPDRSTKISSRLFIVLQPCDVWPRIASARTSQSHRTAGGLHHRRVHLVGLVENWRTLRYRIVVLALHIAFALFVEIRVHLVAVQMQRSRFRQVYGENYIYTLQCQIKYRENMNEIINGRLLNVENFEYNNYFSD